MWVTKLIVPYDETALLGNLAKKYRVTLTGYPLSHFVDNDHIHLITAGYISGDKRNIRQFVAALKEDKRLINLEVKDNFAIMEIEQHISNKHLFEPGIINVTPPTINKEGEYIFELASWDKKQLMKIIKAYELLGVDVKSIKQRGLSNVKIASVMPNLTDKQRKCLQIAIDEGYYGYPRKIDLVALAKIAGISYSTYQFHLRTAEKKVMPSLSLKV